MTAASGIAALFALACGGATGTDTGGGSADIPAETFPPDLPPDLPTDERPDTAAPDIASDRPADAPADVPAPDAPPDGFRPDLPADLPGPDAPTDLSGPDAPADIPADDGPPTFARCFADQMPASGIPPIDYDQYHPVMGTHCKGTNNQDIQGVQRVVFVGDSMTTGTPPTPMGDWYRNRLAAELSKRWGLKAPGFLWQSVDLIGSGKVLQQDSGDFSCCAKFGARTDDLTDAPHRQMVTCNPDHLRVKRTLIVSTIGGNDIFAWAQDLVDGVPMTQLWADATKAVGDIEESIHWAVDDPATFPSGVFIVIANTFEFSDSDSGRDLADCPGAGIISMNTALIDPGFQELVRYFAAEYMRIVTETGIDMVFLGESACGHGYMREDPSGRCYRGTDNALWLDITCMHPGSAGHLGIYDLFLSVIEE